MIKWQKLFILIGFIAVVTLLSSCASKRTRAFDQADDETGRQIVNLSRELLGTPYLYGGQSPSGFDCSGLVRYVYKQVGINVPHSSRLLYKNSHRVNLVDIRPGDLLFFSISRNKVSHVGIYMNNGQFIHAPSSGKKVSMARLDQPYWKKRLIGAGRFH